ncbi:tRNA-uridine aminocarboxypropyltransferase 1-like [Dreissena polymorpha]|uniref:tRNA-uridine aminocarboxypropyltransferase 1 n=1 Tax=Dreissena polymorpha TaxID=45954 RepID=A0A9D4H2L8_DREPO|nr:tRNA-uridine aminocarboxypropyltransferase 1-like [Dreissena polymorpha]KAH3825884.1 hypothetical protein DPMN_127768 [Dreissena polymorpha]
MEEEPFPGLKIESSDFLNDLDGRSKCSKCQRSRKFYCYTCFLPLPEIEHRIPRVKLPLKVDILKHPSEVDGKSTAVHAGIVAPEDVCIYTYPCIPDYEKDKVILVFPCKDSKTLEQLASSWKHGLKPTQLKSNESVFSGKGSLETSGEKSTIAGSEILPAKTEKLHSSEDEALSKLEESPKLPFERVIFIDSTWNQTRAIFNDERLRGIQCVELKSEKTKFWRHQKNNPDTHLATIEAIYYFMREFHEHFVDTQYSGQYDNLLFFFNFMYKKIRNIYDGGEHLEAYKSRKEKALQTKNVS